jgi:RNA polymerase sigma factor for flagellar operon FliA
VSDEGGRRDGEEEGDGLAQPLTPEQQRRVEENAHVARRVLRRYPRLRVWLDQDDRAQEVHLAMVFSARSYRLEPGGAPFPAYCWRRAAGALLRAVDHERRYSDVKHAVLDHLEPTARQGDLLTDTPSSAIAELRDHAYDAVASFTLAAVFRHVPGPEEALVSAERRRLLREAIAALDPKVRVVLELHYLEQIELKDVAERLGVPYPTIRNRHKAGLTQLRERGDLSALAG